MRKDGSRFWAVTAVSNLKDYFGNHVGFAEITRDITERKAAQEAIRRERDLASAMLASLPGVYYMYDQAGHFFGGIAGSRKLPNTLPRKSNTYIR